MRLLKDNIEANYKTSRKGAKSAKKPLTCNLDWETDAAANVVAALSTPSIDLVIACDCIYNDFLIKPFVQCCVDVCSLGSQNKRQTVLLIAQQVRSAEVFESWLEESMKHFTFWRIPDQHLSEDLKSGSGYVIHIGVLCEKSCRPGSEICR